jgi:hypothetical protein
MSSATFLEIWSALVVGAFAATALADTPTIESSKLKLVFREDLNGLASIMDLRTGRDYADASVPPIGLYQLALGRSFPDCVRLTSLEAAQRRFSIRDGRLVLHFVHEGQHPLEVECEITAKKDEPFIHWRMNVRNHSSLPIFAIEFPRASCRPQLGDSGDDDAIVYPVHEGALLCNPGKHFKKGARLGHGYPGSLSAQFLYFFDHDGGLYMAAHDPAGYPKALQISRPENGLILSLAHLFPSELQEKRELPYDVVWSCGEGAWHSGADIYKDWARNQPWCAKKLPERDVPKWLKQGNVFLNYNARLQGVFHPASAALTTFKKFHDFLDAPIIGVPFGWEKHGAWIGPDYFPPFGGEETYTQLSRTLAEKGDRIHVYLSGFRWGVKRPIVEKKAGARKYTGYDGTKDFEQRGKVATVVKSDGNLDFHQPPWADNYTLCVGSKAARDILADCYRKIFAWGVAGIDLDQNVGGAASACFSTEHGHPPGSGVWIHQAMSDFLRGVRAEAKAKYPDSFMGVEEPCEAYIPYLDVYHGRAFTDTVWPVNGPGAVSIPLFIYLYHEYIIGYAGWCDAGFSPMGDARIGLARSFIFGMLPGVRYGGPFTIQESNQTEEMLLLCRIAKLVRKCPDYLLLGMMLPEPKIYDSPPLQAPPPKAPWQKRPALPIPWNVVQATTWISSRGNVCYAVANLSAQPVKPRIEVAANGMTAPRFDLKRVTPDGEKMLLQSVKLPHRLTLDLQPWAVCCIEQLPSSAQK